MSQVCSKGKGYEALPNVSFCSILVLFGYHLFLYAPGMIFQISAIFVFQVASSQPVGAGIGNVFAFASVSADVAVKGCKYCCSL